MQLILFLVLAALVLATAFLYNRLVRGRNRVETAWSDIDVQLQRRHDLVPKLVAAVDQYAKYEKATLTAVAELRSEAMHAAGMNARGAAEQNLSQGVSKLIALATIATDNEIRAPCIVRLNKSRPK